MSHSIEDKDSALTALKSGMSKSEASRKFNIPRPTLIRWLSAVEPSTAIVLSQSEIKRLIAAKETLAIENEILHKAGCSEISPIEVRQEAFLRLCDKYALKTLARVLGLSVGDAHYLRDHRVLNKQIDIEDAELEPKILSIFYDNRECYGKRRIRAVLKRRGIVVSERRVSRIMQKLELKPKHTTYRWERSTPRRAYYPNRLHRQFNQEAPNRVWTSDCTYIRVKSNWYFACTIIDLYARKVVGWGISPHKTGDFIAGVFKRAFYERGNPSNLLFHSDQGSEFTEFLFKQWARGQGIILSYSQVGAPLDNAVSESFFSTAKKEEIRHQNYDSEESLFNSLEDYINWYNATRLHSQNNYQSPQEVEDAYAEKGNWTWV